MRIVETITETAEQAPCRTAAQMADVCCEDTPALPCCEKLDGAWSGLTDEEILDKLGLRLVNGRDENGMEVVIERAPRKNPCGQLVTQYDVSPGRCCDEVTDIVVDDDATPDILPARYSIWIYWEGGRAPFTVKTSNTGTYFQANNRREIVVYDFAVQLTALESFCGATAVTISDGCSTASITIRSDQGQWVLDGSGCALSGVPYDSVASGVYEAVRGMWKQLETVTESYWRAAAYCEAREWSPGQPECYTSTNCAELYCQVVLASRPAGSESNTCLNYGGFPGVSPVFCTTSDGAVIGEVNVAVAYDCRATDGGGTSGSKNDLRGYYRKSASLSLYRWSC